MPYFELRALVTGGMRSLSARLVGISFETRQPVSQILERRRGHHQACGRRRSSFVHLFFRPAMYGPPAAEAKQFGPRRRI